MTESRIIKAHKISLILFFLHHIMVVEASFPSSVPCVSPISTKPCLLPHTTPPHVLVFLPPDTPAILIQNIQTATARPHGIDTGNTWTDNPGTARTASASDLHPLLLARAHPPPPSPRSRPSDTQLNKTVAGPPARVAVDPRSDHLHISIIILIPHEDCHCLL